MNAELKSLVGLNSQVQDYTKHGSVMMRIKISSLKSINGLKHKNGGRLVEWIKKGESALRVNKWESDEFTNI